MEDYGRRIVVDLPFDRTVIDVLQALHKEGIHVLGRFDVREYLKRTLHHDFRRYVLLQAATPRITLDVLQEELAAGAILPITIAIYELADGETAVVVSEPFAPVQSDRGWREAAPHRARLADQESEQLARAMDRFQHEARLYSPTPAAVVSATPEAPPFLRSARV
jgi:uncharacterized protein (DUF302 family)